jgi:hypothetical protein
MGSQAECRRFDSLRPLHNLRLPGPGSPSPLAYRGGLMRHYSTWHRSKRSVAARRLGDSGSREAVLLPCAARADARSSFRGRPCNLRCYYLRSPYLSVFVSRSILYWPGPTLLSYVFVLLPSECSVVTVPCLFTIFVVVLLFLRHRPSPFARRRFQIIELRLRSKQSSFSSREMRPAERRGIAGRLRLTCRAP